MNEQSTERLAWMAQFQMPGAVMGRPETLDLLQEARSCFVHGFDIATVLVATACVEHMLCDELDEGGIPRRPKAGLAEIIETARNGKILPADLLKQVDELREKRNPFSHNRGADDSTRLPVRMRKEKKHPRLLLEEDAKLAISTMYAIFFGTLKPLQG